MNPNAIKNRMRIVDRSGIRLVLLSIHKRFHSLLWFFFMMIARRNGLMETTVKIPVMALAYQCWFQLENNWRINGRVKENMKAITAADKIEYATVLISICLRRDLHLLCCVVLG